MVQLQNVLVLLVEDEPLVRVMASEGLEEAGYAVLEATNAEDALHVLASRPDVGVLFTDVNMPGKLDGLALAELVHRQWPAIKLVVTSGRPLPGVVPDDGRFLAKPYRLEDMTDTIAQVRHATGEDGRRVSPRGRSGKIDRNSVEHRTAAGAPSVHWRA